ncbi:MAG: DNA repair protein RadC [Kiritimatiellae bacterium]|nr:DNA repair protein RadC [Kiritimatiellia bacterium]
MDPTESEPALTIHDLPVDMRPREEFKRAGAKNVSNELLLAILLRSGVHGQNILDFARELLRKAGGLRRLAQMSYPELCTLKVKGFGEVKRLELAAAIELGSRIADELRDQLGKEPFRIHEPSDVFRLMRPLTENLRHERFWIIPLDTRNRLVGAEPVQIAQGGIDATQVSARQVFEQAVRHGAASVVLVHNHPSGDPSPSRQDIALTTRLMAGAKLLELRILDHVIVGKPSATSPGYVSLKEAGVTTDK